MSVKADDVRGMSVVEYLKSLGYVPAKQPREGQRILWYLSPLHDEKTPSFKVDTETNWWIDYGMAGAPGTKHKYLNGRVIEFGMEYFKCDLPTFLSKLTVADFSFHKAPVPFRERKPAEPLIVILNDRPLNNYVLLKYLQERKIPVYIADQFCREVTYTMYGREFYGIGFKNNSGGFEIRNKKFKGSSMPKDIRTIDNGAKNCVLLEGGFELLTFAAIHGLEECKNYNFCVLNGAAMLNHALPFLQQHQQVFMYFNTDETGVKFRNEALKLNDKDNPRFIDQSALYSGANDLNDWYCNFGQGNQKKKGLTP